MSNSSLNMPDSWLDDLLDFGKILLLVDGIDEVKENEQSSVVEWIEELYRLYPKSNRGKHHLKTVHCQIDHKHKPQY